MSNVRRILSFVIPLYNEEHTLEGLYGKIEDAVKKDNLGDMEVIFVDDGSTDGSWQRLCELSRKNPGKVKLIRFRKNFGKSEALAAGFYHSKGDIVFTMDADMQDDPVEIPRFIEKLDEGYDLVSGWKRERHDPISKTIPSKFFNMVTSAISGIKLNDFNCGFKAYRKEVVRSIQLYGELHRYIPVIAYNHGFKVGEIAVLHHPREHGRSKYGFARYFRGFLDLLTVMATTRYLRRPAHLFGGIGIIFGVIGFLALGYLTVLKAMGYLIGGRPLLFFGVMMSIMSVQFITLGLIAELIVHNSQFADLEKNISEKVNI